MTSSRARPHTVREATGGREEQSGAGRERFMFVRCQYLSFHTRSLRTSHVRSMHMLHVTTGTVTVQEQDSGMARWQDGKLASWQVTRQSCLMPGCLHAREVHCVPRELCHYVIGVSDAHAMFLVKISGLDASCRAANRLCVTAQTNCLRRGSGVGFWCGWGLVVLMMVCCTGECLWGMDVLW